MNIKKGKELCMQNYRNRYMPYQENRQTNVCCDKDDALEGMPLAMAYVPWQMWRDIYETEKGFSCGTIFMELNKPFGKMGGAQR